MSIKIHPHTSISQWAEQHPSIINFLEQLNEHDVHWALYCGTAVSLLTGNRKPGDIDVVIQPEDFELVAELAPHGARICSDASVKVPCGDGTILDFPEQSIKFWLDDIEVEVMASGTAEYEHHRYKLALTPLAIQNRLEVTAGAVTLFFSNPFDTIALKSILQRGSSQKKHDASDVKRLFELYPPSPEYSLRRALEIQLNDRALIYLQQRNVSLFTPSPRQAGIPFIHSTQTLSYVI